MYEIYGIIPLIVSVFIPFHPLFHFFFYLANNLIFLIPNIPFLNIRLHSNTIR